MKAEFYYSKRKYTYSLSHLGNLKELRIKNDRGDILAVRQGQTKGLIGKNRKDALEIDVSKPYYYNLIKAAISAIQLVEINNELRQKELIAKDLKHIIQQKDRTIELLNQQLSILQQECNRLSTEQLTHLNALQVKLKQKEEEIENGQQLINQLEQKISQLPPAFDAKKTAIQIQNIIGNLAWSQIAKPSRKELCDSYRQYQIINTEKFTASVTDYSAAGLGLCLVAEREIIKPFFKEFYQFLVKNNPRERPSFQVGGITIKIRGKYTLGSLPILLSWQWESLRQEILALEDYPPVGVKKYQTVFFGNKISNSDYQLVKTFLKQWQHPLSKWLLKGEEAASIIDEIRQLRNRVTHHEDVFYLWQFEQLRSLIIGDKTRRGVLSTIYY